MYSGYSMESESAHIPPWTVQTVVVQGLLDQTAHSNAKISSQAYLEVAMCHYLGFGVARDLAKVIEYIDKAATKGSFQARRVRRRFYDAFAQPCDPLAIDVPLDDDEERQILALEEVEAKYTQFSPFRTVDNINQECFRDSSDISSLTLHEAAYIGDLSLLRDRLASTRDHEDSSGRTALFLSCEGGHLEAMKFLLENGSDPTIPDEDGHTVLHMLIMFDVEEVECALSTLLQFYPDLDLDTYSSQVMDASEHWCELSGTPLHWAVLSANKELVKSLVQHGAKVEGWPHDECPIRLAASLHVAEILEILVGGLPPEYELQGESPFFGLDESNPMRRLLIHGKMYREAVEKTVSVLSRTWPVIDSSLASWNGNPLRKILALNISHADQYIAKALTKFGAGNDVHDGFTLVQTAIVGCRGSPLPTMDEMALDMLELQPSAISTRSRDYQPGWTALHWAAAGGITPVVAKILELAPDEINQRTADDEARTALHLAAESGKSPETIRLLLSCGADPALLTASLQLTPLGAFLSNQRSELNDEVMSILLAASAHINYLAVGSNRWNALHYAVGRAAVLDAEALPGHLLLRRIADRHRAVRALVNTTTAQGWQPLHLAAYFVDAASIAVLITDYSADFMAYTRVRRPRAPV
ncbi:hypothetical protein G7Z17_g97 [Cylindrodendrum hubeiense]|uniref:Ankyrin n=1 Tax=Cylindrodendrum hubeiense TaxID=595255 RepID=A0A9P5LDN9_9HYPO|nr:hypothetical protein G7Z17_g97 [Cylindrodendrum hubeiense]